MDPVVCNNQTYSKPPKSSHMIIFWSGLLNTLKRREGAGSGCMGLQQCSYCGISIIYVRDLQSFGSDVAVNLKLCSPTFSSNSETGILDLQKVQHIEAAQPIQHNKYGLHHI